MKSRLRILTGLALSFSVFSMQPAKADGNKYQASKLATSASFKRYSSECAACHTAYLPQFLPARSWKSIMGGLSIHYGVDASVSNEDLLFLSGWLDVNSARSGKRSEVPPDNRITESRWFKKEHRKIGPSVFARASIKGPSNCQACHVSADKGNFNDDHIQIPR
jgi:mono/diheme cytochrome c family protein